MKFYSILLLSVILKKGVSAFSDTFIYEDAFSKPPFQLYFSDQFLNEKELEVLERETENEIVKMVSKENKEHYICEVPKVKKKKEKVVRRSNITNVKNALSLLEPMKNKCLYHTSGWWNYEFCYGKSIRQYHVAGKNEPARYNSNYILGKYTKYLELSSGKTEETKDLVRITPTGKNYFTQKFIDGTKCDKTNIPRTTEVQYYCGIEESIIYIKETTTCNYEVAISTNRLCKDPVFNPQINNPLNSILCYLYKSTDNSNDNSLTSDDYSFDDDEDKTDNEKLFEIHKKYNKGTMKKASDIFKNKYMKSLNFKNKKVLANPFFKSNDDQKNNIIKKEQISKEKSKTIQELNRRLIKLIGEKENNDDGQNEEDSETKKEKIKLIMDKINELSLSNGEEKEKKKKVNYHISESTAKKVILENALKREDVKKIDDPATKHLVLERILKEEENKKNNEK
ncbi:hypothetical protein BCR36DRAFT_318644 [Piromyces finnis]|uniref:Protein OS-9 homolog n=1 Tax=Piromyces finnis TaxID=1754191 RepID=A0A1Y1VJB0_9FUNG|nr:hypothetical protein BCR36DRAFT_318644 [Piromyces finnis]|eukprot:ORX57799.1 hypothetical protein BCR36DRAFT_318644 [Piromyces finnis]